MIKQTLALFTILSLTACISVEKFHSLVEPKFQKTKTETTTISDNLSFDLSGLDSLATSVSTKKVKSQLIPALLIWKWDKEFSCEINPKIVAQNFKTNFLLQADSLGIQDKIKGQKLEIKVTKIPNSFTYARKGFAVILIVGYITKDKEAISSQEQNLEITYKVTQNGALVKEGNIKAIKKTEEYKNVWSSTKNFTSFYTDKFKANTNILTKEVAQKVMDELSK